MELVLPGSALNALVPRETPVVPRELLAYLAGPGNLDTWEVRVAAEREIQTRLHLYDLLFERDMSPVPEAIKVEFQRNRGACIALLLYLQCRAAVVGTVPDLIDEIAEGGLEGSPAQALPFIVKNLFWLLLTSNDDRLIDSLQTGAGCLALAEGEKCVVQLAKTVKGFLPSELPATISELIALCDGSTKPNAASIAAHYLLARIYGNLGLPCEEKECYSHWRISLTELHGLSPAHLAAKYSKSEPQFSRTIIDGHYRWLQLLEAASETKSVGEIVAEFEAKGYTSEFARFKKHDDRHLGYQCIRVSREQILDTNNLKRLIGGLLTDATQSKACLILKDDSLGEIDEFPKTKSRNLESLLIGGLQAEVSDLAFHVEQEPIDESAMSGRHWILCCEMDNPVSAIAIGILPTKRSLSLCYARAVAFDTRLTQDKGRIWVEETARLLSEQCDAQKLSKLRAAVKQILHKATAGSRAAKYTKVT